MVSSTPPVPWRRPSTRTVPRNGCDVRLCSTAEVRDVDEIAQVRRVLAGEIHPARRRRLQARAGDLERLHVRGPGVQRAGPDDAIGADAAIT